VLTAKAAQDVTLMSGGNALYMSQRGDMLWTFKLGGAQPQATPSRKPPLGQPAPTQSQPAQGPPR